MYTRFSTSSKAHLFAPGRMLRYSPKGPGANFLGMLGGAYEYETEELVVKLIREGSMLLEALQDSSSQFHVPAPRFASQLEQLLDFLRDCGAPSVTLYSFEKAPTLDDLLAAEVQGGGADDWAYEQIRKRGNKVLPQLEAVLADPDRSAHHLSAVRMLLFCFSGSAARQIVQSFVDSGGEAEAKRGAAMLLAATAQDE